MPLTIQDKKDIKEIIDEALTEFANNLIKPSFEMVYKRFEKVEQKLEEHDRRFDKLDDRLDRHGKTWEKVSPATL